MSTLVRTTSASSSVPMSNPLSNLCANPVEFLITICAVLPSFKVPPEIFLHFHYLLVYVLVSVYLVEVTTRLLEEASYVPSEPQHHLCYPYHCLYRHCSFLFLHSYYLLSASVCIDKHQDDNLLFPTTCIRLQITATDHKHPF